MELRNSMLGGVELMPAAQDDPQSLAAACASLAAGKEQASQSAELLPAAASNFTPDLLQNN